MVSIRLALNVRTKSLVVPQNLKESPMFATFLEKWKLGGWDPLLPIRAEKSASPGHKSFIGGVEKSPIQPPVLHCAVATFEDRHGNNACSKKKTRLIKDTWLLLKIIRARTKLVTFVIHVASFLKILP